MKTNAERNTIIIRGSRSRISHFVQPLPLVCSESPGVFPWKSPSCQALDKDACCHLMVLLQGQQAPGSELLERPAGLPLVLHLNLVIRMISLLITTDRRKSNTTTTTTTTTANNNNNNHILFVMHFTLKGISKYYIKTISVIIIILLTLWLFKIIINNYVRDPQKSTHLLQISAGHSSTHSPNNSDNESFRNARYNHYFFCLW